MNNEEINEEFIDNVDESNEEANIENDESVSISKEEYQKLTQTLGSLKRELKDLKKPNEEVSERTNKSGGLDYGAKAFLVANGIKGSETKLVEEAIKNTGESLEQILENPYFQAKLQETRDLAMTANATPKGNRATSVPTDSVEYWMAKPIEEVPQEMRAKVVNARLASDKSKEMFYNS
jgi:hypothetical protein